MVMILAGIGTVPGLWLTVVFFVSAFEHEQFQAEDISGIWFIPETVVLLGSFLFAELAPAGPAAAERGFAVLAVALLGAGGLLFGFTAVILVNRLVLHAGVHSTGAPAMWIMISPLAVTSLTLRPPAMRAEGPEMRWHATPPSSTTSEEQAGSGQSTKPRSPGSAH